MIYIVLAIAILIGVTMGKDALMDSNLEGKSKILIIVIILAVIFAISTLV